MTNRKTVSLIGLLLMFVPACRTPCQGRATESHQSKRDASAFAAAPLAADDSNSEFTDGFLLTGEVKQFGDGDTFKLKTEKFGTVSIRFHGVDTPESKGQDWPAQPYSTEAGQFVREMVGNRLVMVRMKGDRTYNREVGEPFVDGRSVPRELVRNGLGWWYDTYSKEDTDLERLHEAARKKGVGLWADPNPIKPEDWRRGQRN